MCNRCRTACRGPGLATPWHCCSRNSTVGKCEAFDVVPSPPSRAIGSTLSMGKYCGVAFVTWFWFYARKPRCAIVLEQVQS